MARVTAILIALTRACGATHRRIAELHGGRTQADGARLVGDAERLLDLPPGALDDLDLWLLLDERLRALGYATIPASNPAAT